MWSVLVGLLLVWLCVVVFLVCVGGWFGGVVCVFVVCVGVIVVRGVGGGGVVVGCIVVGECCLLCFDIGALCITACRIVGTVRRV